MLGHRGPRNKAQVASFDQVGTVSSGRQRNKSWVTAHGNKTYHCLFAKRTWMIIDGSIPVVCPNCDASAAFSLPPPPPSPSFLTLWWQVQFIVNTKRV